MKVWKTSYNFCLLFLSPILETWDKTQAENSHKEAYAN